MEDPFNKRVKDPLDYSRYQICDANTGLWHIVTFQLLVTAFSFSTSKPYRQPFSSNKLFLLFSLFLTLFAFYIIVFNEHPWLQLYFHTVVLPKEFRYITLMLVLLNTVCTLFFEKIVVARFIQPVSYVKTELKRIARMEAEMSISKGEMMIGGGARIESVKVVRHMTTAMRKMRKKEMEEKDEV